MYIHVKSNVMTTVILRTVKLRLSDLVFGILSTTPSLTFTSDFVLLMWQYQYQRLLHFSISDDVYLINDICAYDTYTSHFSHWCELLTDAERLILEYGRDLQVSILQIFFFKYLFHISKGGTHIHLSELEESGHTPVIVRCPKQDLVYTFFYFHDSECSCFIIIA